MNRKALILSTVLAVGVHSVWGYSSRGVGHSSSPSPQSQDQPSTRLTTVEEQRGLLRHCLLTGELARNHMGELRKSTTHGRPNSDAIQQHLREVRSAVDSMFDDHKRFLYSLTEEQWTAAKAPITTLEQLRASIQSQLQGIDYELQMPTPDSKVLARYDMKTGALLHDWQKQHRKMGAAIGIKP